MQRTIRYCRPLALGLSLLATPLAAQQPAPRGTVADQIAAVVGDSIILKSEIDLLIMQLASSGQQISDTAATRRQLLEQKVTELIILQAAARDTSLTVAEEQVTTEVQRELDARRRQFGGEPQFQAALAQSGMTLEELRNMLAQDIRKTQLMRSYIAKVSRDRKPPPVTEADVRAAFEAQRSTLAQRPATISFSQVVITPRAADSARASARAEALEVIQKIRGGEDFATLARQYSDDPATRERGGDLGWFRSGTMVREFDEMAFALRPGDVSRIVETSFGFHIIKLERVRGAERQARHILIRPDITAEDAQRTRVLADSLAAQVRAGANIDSLSKAIGDPDEQSRIGPYPRDRLPAPYNTELANARAGEVVGPIELATAEGGPSKFAIVKVTDTRAAGEYTFDDPDLRAELRRRLEEQRLIDEIVTDLRKRTLVEYRLDQ